MRISPLIFLMLPVLIVFSNSVTMSFPFSGSPASAPLAQSGSSNYPLSPAQLVYNYNSNNALWLITCPITPELPNVEDDQLFQTDHISSGDWYIAGDQCGTSSSAPPDVTITLEDSITLPSPSSLPTAPPSNIALHISNAIDLSLINLGYSPEAVTQSGNYVSTAFNDYTYIFQGLPAQGQQGLWTWNAKYLGLDNINPDSFTASASSTAIYIPPSSSCTAGSNPLAASSAFPNAFFGETLAAAGYPVTSNNIDFLEALMVAEGQAGTGNYMGAWNPIGLYTAPKGSDPNTDGPCGTLVLGGATEDVYLQSSIGVNALSFAIGPGGHFFGSGLSELLLDNGAGATPFSAFVSYLKSTSSTSEVPGIDSDVIGIMSGFSTQYTSTDALSSYLQYQWLQNEGGGGDVGVNPNGCQYTYTISSNVKLVSIQNSELPFTESGGTQIQIGLLPYFTYDARLINSAPENAQNTYLSYDVYSPENYYTPANRIEPFTINSSSFFFANIITSQQLNYFNPQGYGVDLSSGSPSIGALIPGQSSATTTGITPLGQCPNQAYTSFLTGSSPPSSGPQPPQLTPSQVYSCAIDNQFTGAAAYIITAIAYVESTYYPGVYNTAGAQGLVQLHDHPECEDTCAFNPYTAMQYAYTLSDGGTNWGAWIPNEGTWNGEPAMCQYMPNPLPAGASSICPSGGGGVDSPTGSSAASSSSSSSSSSSTTSGTASSGSSSGTITGIQFFELVLQDLNVPQSDWTYGEEVLAVWGSGESPMLTYNGGPWYNPLSTTQTEPGSVDCDTAYPGLCAQADIQVYPNAATGAEATAATLNNGDYPAIVSALTSGQQPSYYTTNPEVLSEFHTWCDCDPSTYGPVVGLGNPSTIQTDMAFWQGITAPGTPPSSTTSSSGSSGFTLSIQPQSITGIPSGYIFVLGSSAGTSSSSSTGGAGTGGDCSTSPICAKALTQLNVPYCYGGVEPAGSPAQSFCYGQTPAPGHPFSSTSGGFDCSGLVQWVASQLGITLPRTAADQFNDASQIKIISPSDSSQAQAGDLIFFDVPTDSGTQPGHVGICYNTGCTEMVDAPQNGQTVQTESVVGFGTIMGYGQITSSTSSSGTGTTATGTGATATLGSSSCPAPSYDQITEEQFLESVLCASGFMKAYPNTVQANVDLLALWAYYAQSPLFLGSTYPYQGDPLLTFGAQPFYNPILIGQTSLYSMSGVKSFPDAASGIGATSAVLGLQIGMTALESSEITINCPNTECDDEVNYVNAYGTLPSDYVGNYINSWLNLPVPSGDAAASSYSASLTPSEQAYQDAISSPNDNIYILKIIPSGYYNTSIYQPDTVAFAGDQGTFDSNWNTYWNDALGLQGQSVYVVNAIPVSASYAIYSALTSDPSTLPADLEFTPTNMSADQYGDVFITGYDGDDHTWLVELTNTVGGGPMYAKASSICPTTSSVNPPSNACNNYEWNEIAVSPTGSQIYLANYESGYILIFSNNFQYEGDISLSFSTDSALLNGGLAAASYTKASQVPDVNIVDYLENGGLYGVGTGFFYNNPFSPPSWSPATPRCTSSPPYTSFSPPCTTQDDEMHSIMDTESSQILPYDGYGPGKMANINNADYQAEFLDKADLGSADSNMNYHHPISIQDVNGYLYVLDYWSGITGRVCTEPPINIAPLGVQLVSPCVSGDTSGGIGWVGGVSFGILDLRIINSSGVDVPISPTYYNDIWQYVQPPASCNVDLYGISFSPTPCEATKMQRYSGSSQNLYPPYGWILSANITSSTDPSESLQLCGGNPSTCGLPSILYQGSYNPVGPRLSVYHTSSGLLGLGIGGCLINDIVSSTPIGWISGSKCGISNLVGGDMSVGFNDNVSILIPSSDTASAVSGDSKSEIANRNDELLIASFSPQNYTNSIGGNTIPALSYACYTSSKDDSAKSSTKPPGICAYSDKSEADGVSNMWEPVYFMGNPFEYDENIGGYQVLAIDAIIGSAFGGTSSGLGSEIGSVSSLSNPANALLGTSSSTYNTFMNNVLSGSCTGSPCLNNLESLQNTGQVSSTTLRSTISGYAILPYTYTYQGSWAISGISPSASCASDGSPGLSSLQSLEAGTSAFSGTEYAYTTSEFTRSNQQSAQVEGGSTYARSFINTSVIYKANLTAPIVPSQLFYDVIGSRIFGNFYINSTISSNTNEQEIVNAINQISYTAESFTQGKYPGYQLLTATQLSSPCIGPKCSPYLTNTANVYKVPNVFSAVDTTPSLVTLFNWFYLPVRDLHTSLTLTGSSSGESAYGYHRLVYVYTDRFNNTIYMPFDVDIANETTINLNVTPSVNSMDTNQTILYINATASWNPALTSTHIPLNGGYIYLYYDTNLDVANMDPVHDTTDAATCAFANTIAQQAEGVLDCTLANPVYTGLQGSPGMDANVVTYNTDYNKSGSCSQPPTSLLVPVNQIYTMCNIYPSVAAASNPPLVNQCQPTAQDKPQYCEEIFTNGTGICTPQMGLIGIYKTDSQGYFSTNIVACGVGTAQITAQYYGAPTPQPISVSQSLLADAANPSYPASQSTLFNAPNYSWAPTSMTQSVEIGSFVLGIGQITALPLALAVGVGIVGYGILRSRRSGSAAKARPGAARHRNS